MSRDGRARLVEGDCARILARWRRDCVDAVVTDHPLSALGRGRAVACVELEARYTTLARRRVRA